MGATEHGPESPSRVRPRALELPPGPDPLFANRPAVEGAPAGRGERNSGRVQTPVGFRLCRGTRRQASYENSRWNSCVRKKSDVTTRIAPITTVFVVARPTPSAPPSTRRPFQHAIVATK